MPVTPFYPYTANPRFQSAAQQPPATVLLDLDIDDSLVPHKDPDWKKATLDAVDTIHKAGPQLEVMLNTSRALDILPQLMPELNDLTVDYLATNMAQSLYLNPQKLSFGDWLKVLTPADEDKTWQSELAKRFGWSMDTFKETVLKVFEDNGFIPDNATGPWHQRILSRFTHPDGTPYVLDLRSVMSSTYRLVVKAEDQPSAIQTQMADTMVQKVQERLLQEQGVVTRRTRYLRTKDPSYPPGNAAVLIDRLQPQALHKGIVVDHVIRHLSPADHIISAGDNPSDDLEFLKPTHYIGQQGKTVTNHPIQVGDSPLLTSQMTGHPNFLQVKLGKLKDGLVQQLQKLGITV